jgi:hypothetical protein
VDSQRKSEVNVNTLARYLEVIVDPTWDHANRDSPRLAFLACVAIYHAVDRVAEAEGKEPSHFRQIWDKESIEFKFVDILAHHFKHVASSDERNLGNRRGIPIHLYLASMTRAIKWTYVTFII